MSYRLILQKIDDDGNVIETVYRYLLKRELALLFMSGAKYTCFRLLKQLFTEIDKPPQKHES